MHRRGPAAGRADLPAACLSSLRRRRGRPSGHRPRDRPGADGVPARLEHRPPAHRAGLLRLGRPGRGLHRGGPARDAGGGARLLPARPVDASPRRGCAPRSPASARREDPDARLGWYIILGTIPIAVLGLAFKNPIEDRVPHARARSARRWSLFSLVMLRAEAVSRRDRELRRDHPPRRPDHRLRPGPRARAGRLALGRDHLRRPVPELRSHRGRALLVPALGARPSCCPGSSSCATSARAAARSAGATALATLLAFIVGLRVDRPPAALPRAPLDRRSSRPIAWRSGSS